MTPDRNIVRIEGIILNSFRARDADRVVVVFTEEHGKLKALMKSASRSRNRYAASAEVGCLVEGRFYFRSPHAEIGRVIELTTRDPFGSMRQSIERIMVLSYVLNVVEETWPWHDPHPEFYRLFRSVLEKLNGEDDPAKVRSLLRVFESRLLFFLGIHPDLDRCGYCGAPVPSPAALDCGTMICLCGRCQARVPQRGRLLEVGRQFVKFYHDALAQPAGVEPISLTGPAERQAREFFRAVFLNYLGKKLKVLEVRDQLA